MIPERQAFVGLGSNLDAPERRVRKAASALAAEPRFHAVTRSPLYRTPPWGRTDQPDFVNAVVSLETDLSPRQLLGRLQHLEREAGRVRDGGRWGPRVLDLDLLLFGDRELDSGELILPHPRMHQRAFVLVPLLDLAPDAIIPGLGRADELLRGLDRHGIERIGNGQ